MQVCLLSGKDGDVPTCKDDETIRKATKEIRRGRPLEPHKVAEDHSRVCVFAFIVCVFDDRLVLPFLGLQCEYAVCNDHTSTASGREQCRMLCIETAEQWDILHC